jgi:hypothetical protein
MPSRFYLRGAGALVLAGVLAALGAAAGCRSILSIEEREYDSALDDGGTGGGGSDGGAVSLTCQSYCDLLQATCVGANAQFSTLDACLGLCSTFPPGTLDDTSGDTLGCRIHVLETSKAMIEISDCAAAGPGGNGVCGTNCESYCTSMMTVCPTTFESMGDCTAACTPLIECGTYAVAATTPNDPSIQCRLYHVSAASIGIQSAMAGVDTASQIKHCPHASGQTECIPVADPVCP